MIKLITPTQLEAKHLKQISGVEYHICGIGEQAKRIESILEQTIYNIDLVILFGCCGLIHYNMKLGKLYVPRYWYFIGDGLKIECDYLENYPDIRWVQRGVTVLKPIHDSSQRQQLLDYQIVDQESFYIVDICRKYDLPIIVIRYGEDYCDRKMIPIPGVNHLYHKWNHRSCQKKMNKLLRGLTNKMYGYLDGGYQEKDFETRASIWLRDL